jgi:hypothetical protein
VRRFDRGLDVGLDAGEARYRSRPWFLPTIAAASLAENSTSGGAQRPGMPT